MMCALCGLREAAVIMRRSRPGSSANQALCEACARSRGITASQGSLELRIEELLDPENGDNPTAQACPSCGLDLLSFRRERRLGCSACPDAFRAELSRFHRKGEIPAPQLRADSGAVLESSAVLKAEIEALSRALGEEDYEEAARLRDLLALPRSDPSPEPSPPRQPELSSAVVLWSRGRLERNFAELPFPGSPHAGLGLGAERGIHLVSASLGQEGAHFVELDEATRLAYAELGLLSPSFAATKRARAILSRGAPRAELLAVFDEENHLSLRMELPGLQAEEAEKRLLYVGGRMEASFVPAYDPELGYLASSLLDCGRGLRLSVLLHLPALERSALLERALKAVLARGFVLRGRYGRTEASAGDLYELSAEESSEEVGGRELEEAAIHLVRAEERARAQLLSEAPEELLDRIGRALGIALYARRLAEAEALELLSELRLGLLSGLLTGLDEAELARLMARMGPLWLGLEAQARGIEPLESPVSERHSGELGRRGPGGASREALRARFMRALASSAVLEGKD